MKIILRLSSYIFHPLWMPFLGSLFFFLFTPRFFPNEIIKAKLLAIAIITIFIPIVFFYLLKNLGKAETVFLKTVQERRWPLFFYCLLNLMVLHQILNFYNYPGLFYYFTGILISTLFAYMLSWFKVKVSLHMMGITGLLMFITGFCLYFRLEYIFTIAFVIIACGLIASSRLHSKAHTNAELWIGSLLGLGPQLLVIYLWATEYRMLDLFSR